MTMLEDLTEDGRWDEYGAELERTGMERYPDAQDEPDYTDNDRMVLETEPEEEDEDLGDEDVDDEDLDDEELDDDLDDDLDEDEDEEV